MCVLVVSSAVMPVQVAKETPSRSHSILILRVIVKKDKRFDFTWQGNQSYLVGVVVEYVTMEGPIAKGKLPSTSVHGRAMSVRQNAWYDVDSWF